MFQILPAASSPFCIPVAGNKYAIFSKYTMWVKTYTRVQSFKFEENYNFPRFKRGSNILQGVSNRLFRIDTI